MGFRFRKSFKVGPMRVNFSKSGMGYSFGTKGARITKMANGRTRRTVGIPGTGISHVSESKHRRKRKQEPAQMGFVSSLVYYIFIVPIIYLFYYPILLYVRGMTRLAITPFDCAAPVSFWNKKPRKNLQTNH